MKYILTNRTYTGMLIQGKEKRVVKGTHEPLVDVETFDRIQSEFKARSFNISPTPEASENVFKGKVIFVPAAEERCSESAERTMRIGISSPAFQKIG